MNHIVLGRITKAAFFSTLFYGGLIWMTTSNMSMIDQLWCKIAKTAVGAIFNVNQCILEVIMGIPPLHVQNDIICLKHYLKSVTVDSGSSIHTEFITNEVMVSNPDVMGNMKRLFKFLQWKLDIIPTAFSDMDKDIVLGLKFHQFDQLSVHSCMYSKSIMKDYTELLWQASIENKLQFIGDTRFPFVSLAQIPIPMGIPRKIEVIILSFFYKQNLLNAFLYLAQRVKCPDPICLCGEEEQTAYHIITECRLVDCNLRRDSLQAIWRCNMTNNPPADNISLLNCSRDNRFMNCLTEVVSNDSLKLRTKYVIVKNH